ncbi:hypothetical protein BIW11_11873 [Tropilaelaps mercedesae]|uniref:Uncharacterized protein n=1 Tax=Tropilaelaps mercedesae TaxID=418985 RepID=A0A1V9X9S5_9ACAR|nr:hypothetical protein BIW11_11873 [Tropilaelaps mercedesae]
MSTLPTRGPAISASSESARPGVVAKVTKIFRSGSIETVSAESLAAQSTSSSPARNLLPITKRDVDRTSPARGLHRASRTPSSSTRGPRVVTVCNFSPAGGQLSTTVLYKKCRSCDKFLSVLDACGCGSKPTRRSARSTPSVRPPRAEVERTDFLT